MTAGNQLTQAKSMNQSNHYDKMQAFYLYPSQKPRTKLRIPIFPHCILPIYVFPAVSYFPEEKRTREKDCDIHHILYCRNFSVSEELEESKIEQMSFMF